MSDSFSAGITLRFPRITKVRDDKKPNEIESERSLWERYEEVQNSRASADGHVSLQMGSPDPKDSNRPCRFLTEEQYAASKKRKKAKVSRPLQKVYVPSASKQSAALEGVTFAVLGTKGFTLVEGSIDAQEAQENGWIEKARRVKNADSVRRFIQEHGGTLKISPDDSCAFVLGGSRDDPRVARYIQAIENSQSLLQSKSGKAKKSVAQQKQEKIAQSPGVVRWTFVFSMVHQWQSTGADTEQSIQKANPDMLRPTVLDYLVRPVRPGDNATVDPGLFDADLSTVGMMRRAIAFVNQSKQLQGGIKASEEDPTQSNWRDDAMESLGEDDRWVAGSTQQPFWPYKKGEEASPRMVLYPDIYNSPSEDDEVNAFSAIRSSRIASVLPLARVMGAFVCPELHRGVTHVLCDLKEGLEEIKFDDSVPDTVFSDIASGRKLLKTLEELDDSCYDFDVSLVSPSWVRKRKWKSTGGE